MNKLTKLDIMIGCSVAIPLMLFASIIVYLFCLVKRQIAQREYQQQVNQIHLLKIFYFKTKQRPPSEVPFLPIFKNKFSKALAIQVVSTIIKAFKWHNEK